MTKHVPDNFLCKPRGALVTGSGRRIGAAIARYLGREGWHVFVHYNDSSADALAVVAEIEVAGGRATAIQADLSIEPDMQALLARCQDLAPLSVLINNASIFEYDTVFSASIEAMHRNMSINLYAPVRLSQLFHQSIKARGERGCIINMVDNKVFALNPDYFSYTLSKVALNGLTQMLTMAFAPEVRVCGIAPGITLLSGKQTEENFEKAHRNNLLGKGCTVEQIVAAVDFILKAPSYNGQTIVIDGGQTHQRNRRDPAFLSA